MARRLTINNLIRSELAIQQKSNKYTDVSVRIACISIKCTVHTEKYSEIVFILLKYMQLSSKYS